MSVGLYDKALTEKLSKWISDTNMKITSPEETRRLFSYRADINNDGPIQLPLIALRRGKNISVLNTSKKPTTFDGYTVEANDKLIKSLSNVPIQIEYQIDIYTRHLSEADEYVRNFVFNIINYPQLVVQIPYNDVNFEHISNIRMASDIQDNSDIQERLIAGQFSRFTIGLMIDDAYLWSVPVRRNLTVDDFMDVVVV